MLIPRKPLGRRAVLRGALLGGGAVAIPLPRLAAMLNGNGTAYAATNKPLRRFGVWFVGNGFVPLAFTPSPRKTGPLGTLSPILAPLEKVKAKITVVSGFDLKTGRPDGLPHGHFFGGLSGACGNPSGRTFQLPTIDQVIALNGPMGQGVAYKSLQVGVCDGSGGISQQAYKALSSRGPNAQNVVEFSPQAQFDALFKGRTQPASGGGPAAPDPGLQSETSVLDGIRADARALESRLGREDRARLESHLTGLRAIEERLALLSQPGPAGQPAAAVCGKTPAGLRGADTSAKLNPAIAAAQDDVMVMALACDLTRVFFYQLTRPAANIVYPWLEDVHVMGDSKPKDFHGINHRYDETLAMTGGTIKGVDAAIKGQMHTMELFSNLLQKMDAVDEGNGTLLDNSTVIISSCVSWGKTHTPWEWPCVIAGRGGVRLDAAGQPDSSGRFTFKGGWHHRAESNDNFSRVLLTLAHLNGANVKGIGKDGGYTESPVPEICGPST
jgi:hypothetical protein